MDEQEAPKQTAAGRMADFKKKFAELYIENAPVRVDPKPLADKQYPDIRRYSDFAGVLCPDAFYLTMQGDTGEGVYAVLSESDALYPELFDHNSDRGPCIFEGEISNDIALAGLAYMACRIVGEKENQRYREEHNRRFGDRNGDPNRPINKEDLFGPAGSGW